MGTNFGEKLSIFFVGTAGTSKDIFTICKKLIFFLKVTKPHDNEHDFSWKIKLICFVGIKGTSKVILTIR